jgi:hypothetical protein
MREPPVDRYREPSRLDVVEGADTPIAETRLIVTGWSSTAVERNLLATR